MANDYYNTSGSPTTGSSGSSAVQRTEFASIMAGFAKLPPLTGNAGRAIVVNGGGTLLTVTTGTLALAGNFATTGAFNTTLIQGASVSLTLPLASGTLATLAGTETLSNKTLVAPALGTPVSGIATNLTGTAAGLTAGNVTTNANLTGGVTSVGNVATVVTNANLTGGVTSVGNATTVVTNANLTGPITSVGNATSIASQTGTGTKFVVDTSPTLVTPTLGAALATSINGNFFTTGTYTLTGTAGKTLAFTNTLTLSGTDAMTMTFPTTSATIARTDAAQTFTGAQTFSTPIAAASVATMTNTVGGGVPTPPNNTSTFLRGDGTFAAAGASGVSERTSNTQLLSTDNGKSFKITSGTFTQTFDTGANLGATWSVLYENAGTGIITVATDSATWKMYPGEFRQFYSDATNVKSICIRAGTLVDTSSGNLTIAPGWVGFDYEILGCGGGGGGGLKQGTGSGFWTCGGSGGGGANWKTKRVYINDTSLSAGSTAAYTIGAQGTAGAGGTSPTAGGNGGNTTFNGDTAYGGGGGPAGQTTGSQNGGGGAGGNGAGNGSTGGSPAVTTGIGIGSQGVGSSLSGLSAELGGGAGAANNSGPTNAGSSLRGGAGGGLGGTTNSSDTPVNGSNGTAGGTQGSMTSGGGAAGGAVNTNGTNGSFTTNGQGQGGGGGGLALTSTTAGNGGAGSPGCGGGGGGANCGTGTAGNGGLGGTGKIVVQGF